MLPPSALFTVDSFPLRLAYIGSVFKAKMPATATRDSHYYTCPGHLGQHSTDRFVSVGQGKQGRCYIAGVFALNFANVNTA